MSITPGGNPTCDKCGRWYGPGVGHACSLSEAMSRGAEDRPPTPYDPDDADEAEFLGIDPLAAAPTPAIPDAGDERRFRDPATGNIGPIHDPVCQALSHDDEDSCSCGAMDAPDAGDVETFGDLIAMHDGYRVNEDGWTVCLCGHVAFGDDDDGSHARHVAAVIAAHDAAVRREAADERAEQIAQAIDEMTTFAHGNNPQSEAHVLGFGTARRLAAHIARAARMGGAS